MFHRVPFISTASVVTAAVILVLAALFASPFSSPGVALAEDNRAATFDRDMSESDGDLGFPVSTQDPDAGYRFSSQGADLPEVSIYAVMPEVGEEARSITVTLKLSRPLRSDEKFCYPSSSTAPPHDEVCIQGGIFVWDTYDDHLYEEGGSKYDNGHIPSNELVKFVFRGTEVEKRLTVSIKDDECITPGRTVRVAINPAFDSETYGYTINPKDNPKDNPEGGGVVPIDGNDTVNGTVVDEGGDCAPVEDDATEEFIGNHAPLFTGVTPTRSVAENTASGQDIGDPVTASDPEEGDTLTYFLGGPDGSSFAIDSSSGQLRTNVALDHETKDSYTVTVQVRDSMDIHGDPDMTYDDSIDITIEVTDVNEPPAFDSTAPTTLNIIENTTAGVDIGSPVTATDPDNTTPNPTKDTLTYSLDTGDGASFEIDPSGQIKTKDPLDREVKSSYTVTVSVTDGKDATGAADSAVDDTHTVTITIDNEVEPPTFNDGDAGTTRAIAENTPAGRPVGDPVSATSEDGVTLTYSLDDQDGASFDIDSNGQIKTKADLDYEDRSSYFVTVSVTDGQNAMGNTESPAVEDDSIGVTINVNDVNEKPVFADDASTTQTVAENTAADTNIGSAYTATDPENDALTYTLDSGSAATFEIDANGQIKTKADLDYEADSSYTVIVQVTDSEDIDGNAENPPTVDDTHTVTITVTDQDDPGSITFSSDPPIAGTMLTAVLEDQDGVKSDVAVTWEWEISTDQTNWSTITDATTNSYTPGSDDIGDYLRVTATYDDEKAPYKTAEAETGAVLTAPATNTDASFADLDATRSVPENTAPGQAIGAPVAAVDPDSEDTLTYSLGGTDAASFDIDTSNGQLKTKDALDFDSGQRAYSVDVSVSDSKDDYDTADTVVDDTIAVTINVTDVNEKPVFAADAPITQTVAENTAADTNIGSAYTATDDDQDALTYSLGGADAGSFAIDDLTGQLKTNADLDYEDDPSYIVIVQVTDSRGDNGVAESTPTVDATHAVTITVTDQDDDGSITLSSDPPSAGTTATATLEDEDGVKSDVPVTWKWEFSTDQTNWNTITDATTDSYTPGTDDIGGYLRVTATYEDELGSGKTAQTESGAILTAPPTNLQPSFTDPTATRTVAENTPAGRLIGESVAATHLDSVGTLTYSLGGNDAASFDIDSSTGQLKTQDVFNYEIDSMSYFVTVSVSDSRDDYSYADTEEDDIIDVTITVEDVNEPPQFADDAETTIEVSEDTSIGIDIGNRYEATDPENDILTYSLNGTDAALFQVDDNGQLKLSDTLDFETKPTLTVTIQVTDSEDEAGNTENTVTIDDTHTVTVTVTNVFEEPEFEDEIPVGEMSITRSVPENTVADLPVGPPVSATDDEGDTLTYELSGTDADSFNFDTETGQIKTKDPLDHETKETYLVTVSVSDGKADDGSTEDTPVVDTYIDVIIEVEDVNEKPTFGATPPVEYQIAENTAAATPIGAVLTATDPDNSGADRNKDTLTYTLDSDSAATFEIDTSGQIKTKAALDHETTATYNVIVSVRDSRDDAGNPDTADDATIDVIITVTDIDEDGAIAFSTDQPSAGTALTATLTDDDEPISGDTWVWEKSEDGNSWTTITGAITDTYIPQPGDVDHYLQATVTYTDSFGLDKTTEAQTTNKVSLTPPTNLPPSFESGAAATLSVKENTPAGENIGDPFTATDLDTGDTLTYVLGGIDAASFAIVDTTGQIQTEEVLDYENANSKTSYSVTVSVHDGKDPFGNANEVADDTIERHHHCHRHGDTGRSRRTDGRGNTRRGRRSDRYLDGNRAHHHSSRRRLRRPVPR